MGTEPSATNRFTMPPPAPMGTRPVQFTIRARALMHQPRQAPGPGQLSRTASRRRARRGAVVQHGLDACREHAGEREDVEVSGRHEDSDLI